MGREPSGLRPIFARCKPHQQAMIKITFYALLILFIFSCFRKKSPPRNVDSWLAQQFPGQYEVVVSNLKMLDIVAQYKGQKQAIVADKADPEVQFLLDWWKGGKSTGLDSATVLEAHERAKTEVVQARQMFKLLKSSGLEKFSVGVVKQSLCVQVFAEPTPATREHALTCVKSVLDAQPEHPQTSVFIKLMEEATYRTEFQDIIPLQQGMGMGWNGEQTIMSLNFEWSRSAKTSAIMRHWEANPGSKRSSQYQEVAAQHALAWAEKNLPKPFYMPTDQPVGFQIPESGDPAIRYGFPYFDKKTAREPDSLDSPESKGYVCGTYYVDTKVFSGLRKQKEF